MAQGKRSAIRSGIKRKRATCEEESEKKKNPHHLQKLPEELLIKVICGVNYADLKNLLLVSRQMVGATRIAKEIHFDYTTPAKVEAEPEMETLPAAAAAPRALIRKRLTAKEASDLSVTLFPSSQ